MQAVPFFLNTVDWPKAYLTSVIFGTSILIGLQTNKDEIWEENTLYCILDKLGFKRDGGEKGSPATEVQRDRYGGSTGGIFSKLQSVGEFTLIDFAKTVSYIFYCPSKLSVRYIVYNE